MLVSVALKSFLLVRGLVRGCLLGLHSPTVGCSWGWGVDLGLVGTAPTPLSLWIFCQVEEYG